DERPPGKDVDLTHIDAPPSQLRSGFVNVAHHYLQVVQRSGQELGQPFADGDRARGAGWSELHKADVITQRVIMVEDETSLVDVEGFGAVDIADRHTDKFELDIHASTVSAGADRTSRTTHLWGSAMEAWLHDGRSSDEGLLMDGGRSHRGRGPAGADVGTRYRHRRRGSRGTCTRGRRPGR